MDTANVISLVEHLEDNVEELEEHFEPLLSAALAATTKKLPLLDKAKLYVLIVYSIESLLFCAS
jgi:exosome complex protein LRP1